MVAIERNGAIKTFNRLPNEWNDDKGYHINFRKITNKEDYGFYDVVIPSHDSLTQNLSEIFWDADNKVFTYTVNNIDFDATYTVEVEDEEGNKTEETKPVYDQNKLKADAFPCADFAWPARFSTKATHLLSSELFLKVRQCEHNTNSCVL